ncbi:hypothetical protein C0Z10_09115 [Acidipropionibacterium jensenii]|uniref:Uncharacterized protein n=1 Tax=Acidipropionibacterium jensenii TaxID=1749 RepID=A0A3Q9ULI0_9ACTN|nr:hypothetical protein C0Z10_09115 [Acidipropionibacterium jensenii]
MTMNSHSPNPVDTLTSEVSTEARPRTMYSCWATPTTISTARIPDPSRPTRSHRAGSASSRASAMDPITISARSRTRLSSTQVFHSTGFS